MQKVKTILLAMFGEIYTKEFILHQLRKKNFRGTIRVLTNNDREDELIRNAGGDPVSIPAVQMGEKMAQISMDE